MRRFVPVVVVLLTFGCGSQLRHRARTVQETADQARLQGALKCAPRELAMAQSHVGFARAELDAGNYWRALAEVDVADDNARVALARSPNPTCAPIPPVRDTDGDGLMDPVDKCPTEPEDKDGFEDEDGCPDPDNDKDGLLDAEDKCPNEAGPKENAGCPDTDKDGDGVVDRLDKCPEIPGDKDNDGCPKQKYIVVTKEKIELKQKVHFATNKSLIMPDSFAMLNEIADVLKTRPEVRVRIEGHTDSRGGMKHNMKLSQARADSVKQYLVEQTVPADHMEARGFGPTQPIDDNRTEKGREQNRRVEFIITAQ
jgi:outer membrane protein OmpA-like peptidoglycan-associated protein